MSDSLLDSLQNQQPLFQAVSGACRMTEMPVFIDLCWGGHFDIKTAFCDPGVQFDTPHRRLVLLRVNNEIRYYAGTPDPTVEDPPEEIGVFPTQIAAMSFAYDFLVKQVPLSEITTERVIRSPSCRK